MIKYLFPFAAALVSMSTLAHATQEADHSDWTLEDFKEASFRMQPTAILTCLEVTKPDRLDWSERPFYFSKVPSSRITTPNVTVLYKDTRPYMWEGDSYVYQVGSEPVCRGSVELYDADKFDSKYLSWGDIPATAWREAGVPAFESLDFFDYHYEFIDLFWQDEQQWNIYKVPETGAELVIIITKETHAQWREGKTARFPIRFLVTYPR